MRKIFINRVEHGSVGVDERTCRKREKIVLEVAGYLR